MVSLQTKEDVCFIRQHFWTCSTEMTKAGSCQDIVKIATTSSQRTQELHWMIRPVGITTEDKPGFLAIVLASMKPPKIWGAKQYNRQTLDIWYTSPHGPEPIETLCTMSDHQVLIVMLRRIIINPWQIHWQVPIGSVAAIGWTRFHLFLRLVFVCCSEVIKVNANR